MSCKPPEEGYTLIIAEKPKAAKSIAYAISVNPSQCKYHGVPYWMINNNGRRIIVAPVAGHLFGLNTDINDIPVFKYYWAPRWEVERKAYHTKKFYNLIKHLSRNPSLVVNACDYDVEGSVIGYLVITIIVGKKFYKRMKFSSLTPEELRGAFNNLQPQDTNMVEAGLCRHELDWIYGINLSRLLTKSYRNATSERRILSVGRVQTPTLIEVINRYMEVETFSKSPVFGVYASISYKGKTFTASYIGNPIRKYIDAKKIKESIENASKASIIDTKRSYEEDPPPPPYNLNDLQEDAYRLYKFSPSYAQKLAEDLYLDGLISYPRTNSQKLPPGLNTRKILDGLSEAGYSGIVDIILKENPNLVYREGRKTDPAHPAIYPTGIKPRYLKPDHKKLYDLIARRFLAVFLPSSLYAKIYIKWLAGVPLESYLRTLVKEGWLIAYRAGSISEEKIIEPKISDKGDISKVVIKTLNTDKPTYHTKTSILRWMENNNIGTEATRAEIIEILYKRGYVKDHGGKAKPTSLGLAVAEISKTFFPELTSVELTRSFEEKIQKIRDGELTREVVVEQAKKIVKKLVEDGLAKQREIEFLIENLVLGSGKKCVICGASSINTDLCPLHTRALEELIKNLDEWCDSYGITREEALRKIAKSRSVGKAAREVAQGILDEKIII
jgi:DNA topoisomerase-1